MNVPLYLSRFLERFLPSPLAIAIILTLLSFGLALGLTTNTTEGWHMVQLLQFWHDGIFNANLIVFAYQMMLILVLGHILVLSQPVQAVFKFLLNYVTHQSSAIIVVSVFTMLAGFLNWGLGLIFGAILARKVGEHAYQKGFSLNYPLICALGYSGMMIWHGGMSGSATIKVAEAGHLASLVPEFSNQLPNLISTAETTFSWQNISLFVLVLVIVPCVFLFIKPKTSAVNAYRQLLQQSSFTTKINSTHQFHYLDQSPWLSKLIGVLLLVAAIVNYHEALLHFQLTPNLLNLIMLGLGFLCHSNLIAYTKALKKAIGGAAGILIQFPLYFGIMGIMRDSGLVTELSQQLVRLASQDLLPLFTFLSAALVNLFVPSGGGQWAIQGPIIINSANSLGVDLRTLIMSMAYGDQVTNMLQPFWALPLLSITKVKARDLLTYTILMMLIASLVFMGGLLILY